MNHRSELASAVFRVARNRKPAVRMMIRVAIGLTLLLAWAGSTPISDSVSYVAKIVPKNRSTNVRNGVASLSTSVSGKVVEIPVHEGQEVEEGQLLVRLDTQELQVNCKGKLEKIDSLSREARAKVKQVQLAEVAFKKQKAELLAQLLAEKKRKEGLTFERSIKIKSASSEVEQTGREFLRFKKLIGQRAISQSELDAAKSSYLRAKEALALARLPVEESRVSEFEARIESLESSYFESVHGIETEKLSLESRVAITRNELELLESKIAQCEIRAPVEGLVSTCAVSVGDWVSPGPVDVTVSQTGFVAEAFLPSQLISNVKPGDTAQFMLDGVDWMVNGTIEATVISISPELCHEEVVMGTGATQVVDGYRVLLELTPNNFKLWNSVRIGMTGAIQIETGQKNLAIYLLEKAFGDSFF